MNNTIKLINKKLHSKKGESLSETLVALLLSALALVMLAGAVSASFKVVNTSKTKLNEYYANSQALVSMSSAGTAATISIAPAVNSDKLNLPSYAIQYYKNDSFSSIPVISYKR